MLYTKLDDKDIFLAKIELFNELVNYDKVKTFDQRKALTYFLEYLFLIQDDSLSDKFREIRENSGGVLKMSIDEIREIYLKEEGREEGDLKRAKIGIRNMLEKNMDKKTIAELLEVDISLVEEVAQENKKSN